MRLGSPMNTFSGIDFYPLDPKIEEIKTEDIAHALSLICRANGHSRHFYSVAQHSLNCALEAKKRNYSRRIQLGCLLHDGSEAYISDIIRPVKSKLTDYHTIEDNLQNVIYEAYGLGDLTKDEQRDIAAIDDAMLAYELKVLLNEYIEGHQQLLGVYDLSYRPMDEVKGHFILKVEKLREYLLVNQA